MSEPQIKFRPRGGRIALTDYRPPLNTFVCVNTLCKDLELSTAGRLVAIVKAGAMPEPSLAKLFEGQPPSLKQTRPPVKPSKHERWLVERRTGRVFVHTMDKWTYFEEIPSYYFDPAGGRPGNIREGD